MGADLYKVLSELTYVASHNSCSPIFIYTYTSYYIIWNVLHGAQRVTSLMPGMNFSLLLFAEIG